MRLRTDSGWREQHRPGVRASYMAKPVEARRARRRALYPKELAKVAREQLADVSHYVNVHPSELPQRRVGALLHPDGEQRPGVTR